MSQKVLTPKALTLYESSSGNCFRYEMGNVQIVFGVSKLGSGWEQEVYIPNPFVEPPVVIATPNTNATVGITNTYKDKFYCYASAECYVRWIAIGKWK